ncbi:MAG: Enolase [archaeon GW2011_AR13]|nr:MAG: Enolase [archaeon GW2011_AR13]HIG94998.1 hypothetical protein [Nanoarchaeota archaeon]HIH62890.1 hypothetical protein [Nanoarchaeota archaeon]HIJ10307.1 hypothetical protein [Nanoarchaeota archaeon]
MIVQGVSAKEILDSREEKTIFVTIKTNLGDFSASAPNGKSKGKFEKKIYKKNLETDIKTLEKFNDYFTEEIIDKFDDLRRIEDILDGHVGGNTILAFEFALLKALAKEQKKEIWELINPNAKKFPRLVGNCIGGGLHSNIKGAKKPDFQEFLLIPDTKTVKEAWELNKKAKKEAEELLKNADKKFKSEKNDEDAWITSLNEKQVLEILSKLNLPIGLDLAASSFYARKNYNYSNPMLRRSSDEQIGYLTNLIKNYNLFYIEDAFEEQDFSGFAKLTKLFPNRLIVGDDLTVTNQKRLEQAIREKSINALIVKPNQCGSLIEVKNVVKLARKNNLKIIFSHRSGETEESILADLAFGFQADFFKSGITGKEREVKIKRLIEIEDSLKNK